MLALISLLVLGLSSVDARRTQGVVQAKESEDQFFVFANFCFDCSTNDVDSKTCFIANTPGVNPDAGTIVYTLKYPSGITPSASYRLVSYSDLDNSWGQVYDVNTGKYLANDCEEREGFGKVKIADLDGVEHDTVIYQGLRPRFWYFALSCCDCDGTEGKTIEGIEFDVHFLNDKTDWKVHQFEFGVDEFSLRGTYVAFLVLYIVYLFVHGWAVKEHYSINGGTVHQFIVVFSGIVMIEVVSVFLCMMHWIAYGQDGIGHQVYFDVGQCLDIFARVLFMALLLFLAEGWTISTITLPSHVKAVIVGSFSFTFVSYAILLIWGFTSRRAERVRPIFAQQVLVYIIMAAFIFFACWLMFSSYKSFAGLNPNDESQKSKRNLFLFIGVLYGLWILAVPVVEYVGIVVASSSPWVYQRTLLTFNLSLTLLGFALFTGIIWPSHASKYFGEPTRTASAVSDTDYQRL